MSDCSPGCHVNFNIFYTVRCDILPYYIYIYIYIYMHMRYSAKTETILHFFYKLTNGRGTKTLFTYAHVKWFYGQSERAYHLNYFIILFVLSLFHIARLSDSLHTFNADPHELSRFSKLLCNVLFVQW